MRGAGCWVFFTLGMIIGIVFFFFFFGDFFGIVVLFGVLGGILFVFFVILGVYIDFFFLVFVFCFVIVFFCLFFCLCRFLDFDFGFCYEGKLGCCFFLPLGTSLTFLYFFFFRGRFLDSWTMKASWEVFYLSLLKLNL